MLLLIWLRILLLLLLVVVVVVVTSSGLLSSSTGSANGMAVPQTHRTSFSLLLPLLLVAVLSRNDCSFLLSRSCSASSCSSFCSSRRFLIRSLLATRTDFFCSSCSSFCSFRRFLICSLLATRTASFCSGLCNDRDTLRASVAFLRHISFFSSVFPLHFFFLLFTSRDFI